jgi:hypothetical protein
MTEAREKEIRDMVRDAIAYHVEIDLNGDEQLMKEVWEEMQTKKEFTVAKSELKVILAFLRRETA